VNYNGGTGILVNGVEVTGNGTYNGFLIVGDTLLSFVESFGIDLSGFSLPDLPSIAEVLGCLSIYEIGVALVDIEAAVEVASAGIELASNPVGWAVAFAIVDAGLTLKYPDIMVPVNLKSIPVVGIWVSLYALQSELRGDGDPLTPERLQKDLQKANTLLIGLVEDDEENYPELPDGQTSLLDFWWPKILENEGNTCGGSDGGNSTEWANAILDTCRIFKNGISYLSNGVQTGDTLMIAKGLALTSLSFAFLAIEIRGISYDNIEESMQKYFSVNTTSSGSSGGGGGGATP
jgi:hypothetical protein